MLYSIEDVNAVRIVLYRICIAGLIFKHQGPCRAIKGAAYHHAAKERGIGCCWNVRRDRIPVSRLISQHAVGVNYIQVNRQSLPGVIDEPYILNPAINIA